MGRNRDSMEDLALEGIRRASTIDDVACIVEDVKRRRKTKILDSNLSLIIGCIDQLTKEVKALRESNTGHFDILIDTVEGLEREITDIKDRLKE